jgi:type I restriction enzyme S subunit
VSLGKACQQDRQIVDPGSREARELAYLSLEHIEPQSGRILKQVATPAEVEGTSTTFRFDARHVLYGKLRPYLNKVALPDGIGRCTTEMIPLLPAAGVNREFLAWILRREETIAWAMRQKTGARMPRADMESLLGLEISLPPPGEQEQIAGRLTRQLAAVERARLGAQSRLVAAVDLTAAYLREGFEGPEASRWESEAIGEFAKTCSGTTPSRADKGYFGGGIPWVKTGELRDGLVGDDGSIEESVTEAALRDCSLPLLPAGTLLIAMYGQGKTRGRTGILTRAATTNQACFAILPRPDVFDTMFLQLWFRANYGRLRALTENRGGNQPNLNGVLLRALRVPLPPPADQRRIAAGLTHRLEGAKRLAEGLSAQLAAIEALPALLLREAFKGND